MRKRTFKFGMLALVALALTYCQREDAPEAPQQDPVPAVDPQAVVSLNEAKSLFEASENQKRTANSVSRRKYPFIELETDWRYFEQMKDFEEMPYAKVPVRISKTELNGEVLFLKKDGKTKQYLFLTQIDSIMADRRIINADFYLLDTKGVFLSAYRMTDGVITHKIVPKRKGSYRIIDNNEASATAEKPICRSCPFIIAPLPFSIDDEGDDPKERGEGGGGGKDYFVLEPVTVYGRFPRKSRNKSDFPHYTYYDYSPYGYGDFYDDRDREDKRIALQELREKRRAIGGGGSSSNVGAGMAKEEEEKEEAPVPDRPDHPISNNKCFFSTVDLNKGATLTIYVDEPKPGTGGVIKWINVGHTFIGITQGENQYTYGFYPNVPGIRTIGNNDVSSVLGKDDRHTFLFLFRLRFLQNSYKRL
ncbi:hypothetical protein [Capnocytophaga sp. oral taxon 323]|uniref:hypothetical protein n=1 Tax=Capnocytophaga sp. oral taxon 323 TaxID=1705617 RepID=UPI000AD22A17|nr:hypothetical protein [Capnocytophaga sp. oral taxon 323]